MHHFEVGGHICYFVSRSVKHLCCYLLSGMLQEFGEGKENSNLSGEFERGTHFHLFYK